MHFPNRKWVAVAKCQPFEAKLQTHISCRLFLPRTECTHSWLCCTVRTHVLIFLPRTECSHSWLCCTVRTHVLIFRAWENNLGVFRCMDSIAIFRAIISADSKPARGGGCVRNGSACTFVHCGQTSLSLWVYKVLKYRHFPSPVHNELWWCLKSVGATATPAVLLDMGWRIHTDAHLARSSSTASALVETLCKYLPHISNPM